MLNIAFTISINKKYRPTFKIQQLNVALRRPLSTSQHFFNDISYLCINVVDTQIVKQSIRLSENERLNLELKRCIRNEMAKHFGWPKSFEWYSVSKNQQPLTFYPCFFIRIGFNPAFGPTIAQACIDT